jgi:hypothetical protein
MNRYIIAAAFAAFAAPAVACDNVLLHVASYHTDRGLIADVNETNPGLGCRFRMNDAVSVEGGFYKNSYALHTNYAVIDWTHSSGLGVYAGLATGYDEPVTLDNGLTPLAGLVFHIDYVTLRATPSYNPTTETLGAVFALSLVIR